MALMPVPFLRPRPAALQLPAQPRAHTLRAPSPPYPGGPRSPPEKGCMSAEPTMFELTQVLNSQRTSSEHMTARSSPGSGALRTAWPHTLPDSHVHPGSPTQSCPEPRAWEGAGTPSSELPLSSPVRLHLRQDSAWPALLHQLKARGPALPRKGREAGGERTARVGGRPCRDPSASI